MAMVVAMVFWIFQVYIYIKMAGASDDLVLKFQEYCTNSELTTKACTKMFTECIKTAGYKKYDTDICDILVSKLKEKGKQYIVVNKANVDTFMTETAHKIAMETHGSAEVIKADLVGRLVDCVKATNVVSPTDTAHYTGAHKERTDESGKGKGSDGRPDKVDDSGYVSNYKGEEGSSGKE